MQITFIILTILLGFILIISDILFIPGGLVASAGILIIAGAVGVSWKTLGSTTALYLAAASLVIGGIILWVSIKFKLWRIFVRQEVEKSSDGFTSCSIDLNSYIGKKGTVVTPLRPGGIVSVEDKKLDAITEEGYIDGGSVVVVSGISSGQLKVKAFKQ